MTALRAIVVGLLLLTAFVMAQWLLQPFWREFYHTIAPIHLLPV